MLNIGFACEWLPDRERTWSYTPISLLKALKDSRGIRFAKSNALFNLMT